MNLSKETIGNLAEKIIELLISALGIALVALAVYGYSKNQSFGDAFSYVALPFVVVWNLISSIFETPIGIAILIALAGWWILNTKRTLKPSTKDMWKQAEKNMERVLDDSPLLGDSLDNEKELISAMEADMMRLRERFKHDSKKQTEIAKDWLDYSEALSDLVHAREMLAVDVDDSAFENFYEEKMNLTLRVEEITKRVEKELGKDCLSIKILDKLMRGEEVGKKKRK